MMHWIRLTVLILIAAILQTSLVTAVEFKPNFLLILLVYFALHTHGSNAILASFVIGLLADLVGSGIGPQLIAFGLTGSLIGELRKLIVLRSVFHQILVVLIAGVLSGLLTIPLYAVKGCSLPTGRWHIIVWEPLFSAILAPIVFMIINFIMGHSIKRKRPLIS